MERVEREMEGGERGERVREREREWREIGETDGESERWRERVREWREKEREREGEGERGGRKWRERDGECAI